MTQDERRTKLAQLHTEIETLTKSYNELFQDSNLEDAMKVDATITEKCNEYTRVSRDLCFEDCKLSGDPMLAAVKAMCYTTIAVKDMKDDDTNLPVRKIVPKDKKIDLLKLHNYCGGIGVDTNWAHVVQKLNFLLTAREAMRLNVDPKFVNDSYTMSARAKQIELGMEPTGRLNLFKALQAAVSAMIGDSYRITMFDVNCLIDTFTRDDRAPLTVVCPSHAKFRELIMNVCHHIVTGEPYKLKSKAIKSK